MHLLFSILISLSFLYSEPGDQKKTEFIETQVNEVKNLFESFVELNNNSDFKSSLNVFLIEYRMYLRNEEVYNALIDKKAELEKQAAFEILLKDDAFRAQTISIFNEFKYLVDRLNILLNTEQKSLEKTETLGTKFTDHTKNKEKYPYLKTQNIFDSESLSYLELYGRYKAYSYEYFDYLKKFEGRPLNEEDKKLFSRYQLELDNKNKELITAIEFLIKKDKLRSLIKKVEKQLEALKIQKKALLESDLKVVLSKNNNKIEFIDLKPENVFNRPNFFRTQQLYSLMAVDININVLEAELQKLNEINNDGKIENILTYLKNYDKIIFISEKAFNEYKDFVSVNNAILSNSVETIIEAKVRTSVYEKTKILSKNFGSSFSSFAISILATEMFTGLSRGYFLPEYSQKHYKNYTVNEAITKPFINNFNSLESATGFALPLINFSSSASATSTLLTPMLVYMERFAKNYFIRSVLGSLGSATIFGATMTVGMKVSELTSLIYLFRKEIFFPRYKDYKNEILPTLIDFSFNETTAIKSIESFLSFFIVVKIFDSDWPIIKKNFLNLVKKEKCKTTYDEFRREFEKKINKNKKSLKQATIKTTKEIIGAQILSGIFLNDLIIGSETRKIQSSKIENLKNIYKNEYKVLVEKILEAKLDKDFENIYENFPIKEVGIALQNEPFLKEYISYCLELKAVSIDDARSCIEDLFIRFFNNETNEEAKINDEILNNNKKILEFYKDNWIDKVKEEKDSINEKKEDSFQIINLTNTSSILKHISYISELAIKNNFDLILNNISILKNENFSKYLELNKNKDLETIIKNFCTPKNNQDEKEYCELLLFENTILNLKEAKTVESIYLIFNYMINERGLISFTENYINSPFINKIIEATATILINKIDVYLNESNNFVDYKAKVKELLKLNKKYLEIYEKQILNLYTNNYEINNAILETNLNSNFFLNVYLKITSQTTKKYYPSNLEPLYINEAIYLVDKTLNITRAANLKNLVTPHEFKLFTQFLNEINKSYDEKDKLKFIINNFNSNYYFIEGKASSSYIYNITKLINLKLYDFMFKNKEYKFIYDTFNSVDKTKNKLYYFDIISKYFIKNYLEDPRYLQATFKDFLEPEKYGVLYLIYDNKNRSKRIFNLLFNFIKNTDNKGKDDFFIEKTNIFVKNLFKELYTLSNAKNNLELNKFIIEELSLIKNSEKYSMQVNFIAVELLYFNDTK